MYDIDHDWKAKLHFQTATTIAFQKDCNYNELHKKLQACSSSKRERLGNELMGPIDSLRLALDLAC